MLDVSCTMPRLRFREIMLLCFELPKCLCMSFQCNGYKGWFGWYECAKVATFWVIIFWSYHILTIGSWRLPKHSRILKISRCPLWAITKFGSLLLRMIATVTTSQNWKKQTLTLITIQLINIFQNFTPQFIITISQTGLKLESADESLQ